MLFGSGSFRTAAFHAIASAAWLAVPAVLLAMPESGWAQRSKPCGCYCNIWLPAPCSDNACKAACGWVEPSSGGGASYSSVPPIDYEAQRRAEEESRRQQEEAERQERERVQARKQREFETQRNEAAKSLKGQAAASPAGNTPAFGLKGVAPQDAGLRAPSTTVERDLGGQRAAWKQLHCVASIVGPALAAVLPPEGKQPDFNESRYLLSEAENVLNGQRAGVQCGTAPPLPQISGKAPDMARGIELQRRLLAEAKTAVDRLEDARRPRTADEARIAIAYAQQQANQQAQDRKIAPIREQQRQINREREAKRGNVAAAQVPPEVMAKKDLERAAANAKKMTEGDFTSVSVSVSDAEPASPPARGKKSAPERQ